MMNFKYYIILIIGIFLALGLGILVGISLENKNILENQQKQLTKQIEEEFNIIRTQTEQWKNNYIQLEQQKQQIDWLCNVLFDEIIKDKLSDIRVTFISLGENNSIYQDIISILENAGAKISSSYIINSSLNEEISQIYSQYSDTQDMPLTSLYQYMGQDLIFSITEGQNVNSVYELIQNGAIKNTVNIEDGCNAIILSGDYIKDKNFELLTQGIVKAAQDLDIAIIGISNSSYDIEKSTYRNLGISTIENIDSLYGRLCLVSLLCGNSGNYGIREQANGILPDPLFPADIRSIYNHEKGDR
ncbi:MAG: copper transporter [Xylanivirga thermophila]|jgi:hypothetical protein|uniref:copper transporter n=1 Tax=Xylanivirga thermophila TaxID=2496273 RepID=UPI00101CBEEC|nr:copper transporter [Xylanivirga thermophila]